MKWLINTKLNELFHRPKMLATIMFSTWFIIFQTTAGFCRLSAQTMLSLSTGEPVQALDLRLVKSTAIVIQTWVCLILYFFRRPTFALNTIFAAYRIIFMVTIFVIGVAYSGGPAGRKDFNVEYPGYNAKDVLSAFIYIIACSQGYENANYVSLGNFELEGVAC